MSQDIARSLHEAIASALPGATIDVTIGAPGHFSLRVVCEAFAGKTPVAKQRLVYSAITALMAGEVAPVHAIDKLETISP